MPNPHLIHCPICTVEDPCESCQRQVDAEAAWVPQKEEES